MLQGSVEGNVATYLPEEFLISTTCRSAMQMPSTMSAGKNPSDSPIRNPQHAMSHIAGSRRGQLIEDAGRLRRFEQKPGVAGSQGVHVVRIVRRQGVGFGDQAVLHGNGKRPVVGETDVGAGDGAPGVGMDPYLGHHHRQGIVRLQGRPRMNGVRSKRLDGAGWTGQRGDDGQPDPGSRTEQGP